MYQWKKDLSADIWSFVNPQQKMVAQITLSNSVCSIVFIKENNGNIIRPTDTFTSVGEAMKFVNTSLRGL
jgi:hypothetical protein